MLRDAQAILCHIANKYDAGGTWLPRDERFGPVMMWLMFAGGELMAISAARMIAVLNYPGDLEAMREKGRAAMRVLEDHLTERGFSRAAVDRRAMRRRSRISRCSRMWR